MPRVQPVDVESATGRQKELLDTVQAKLGGVPNIFRTFAHSPSVLEFYLNGSQALAGGTLSGAVREQIALVVGETNSCDYCLAAHTVIGKSQGLTDDQAADARRGQAADAKTTALLTFARTLVEKKGFAEDGDLQAVRDAGWSEGEIVETIANVTFNIFTNYFNHVTDPEVDFPKAPQLAAS